MYFPIPFLTHYLQNFMANYYFLNSIMLAITGVFRFALSEHLKAYSEIRFFTKCVKWGMGAKFILIRFIHRNNFSEI